MKKLLLTAMMVGAFLATQETNAQVRVNLNVNIGNRPAWGIPGAYAGDYYYLPEIDTYYDIPRRQFIYFDAGNWVFAAELPYSYRGYDLYRGYKVVINEPRPYLRCDVYRTRYNQYYNTYRRPGVVVQRPVYPPDRYEIDRYHSGSRDYRGRDDDRRRDYYRDDRDDRNDRGRGNGNGRDRDHDRGRRGRG
jgi:hypothetical protein